MLRAIGKERQVDGAMMLKYSDAPQYVPVTVTFDRHPGGVSQEPSQSTGATPFSIGARLIYRGLAYYGYIATVNHFDQDAGVKTVLHQAPCCRHPVLSIASS